MAAGSSTDVFALARYLGGDGQRKLVYYGPGDSVASGHGLSGGGQDPVRCNCRRSPLAYPSLVSDDLGNLLPRYESVRFSHLACSGALSEIEDSDERCDPVDLPEQVSQLLAEPFPPDQTTLVSLTIGANDVHFPREAMPGTHICESNYQTWLTEVTTRIQIQVERQLLRLLAIENLYIVLTDYYNPFNQTSGFFDVMRSSIRVPILGLPNPNCEELSDRELYTRTEHIIDTLNTVLKAAVASVGHADRVGVALLRKVFRSRESAKPNCGASGPDVQDTLIQYPRGPIMRIGPQVFAVLFGNDCFHPNEAGAKVFANVVYHMALELLP